MTSTVAPTAETEGPTLWRTTAEVATRYRTVPSTVRYWRHIGYGPSSIKLGRRVLYAEAELQRFDAWLKEQSEAQRIAS